MVDTRQVLSLPAAAQHSAPAVELRIRRAHKKTQLHVLSKMFVDFPSAKNDGKLSPDFPQHGYSGLLLAQRSQQLLMFVAD
jgi:hypothetical protein